MAHNFLRHHRDEIIATWEHAAATDLSGVMLTGLALRDHLPEFLDEFATWLEGSEPGGTPAMRAAVAQHVAARIKDAYQLRQVVSEFTLLRTTILRLLLDREPAEQADDCDSSKYTRAVELARLNAGLDCAVADIVQQFVVAETAQRNAAENALREGEIRYRALFDTIDEGFCVVEVLFDRAGKPTDYRFLEVNSAFEKHTGLVDATGKRMRQMVPQHDEHWFQTYGRVALTGDPIRFQNRAEALARDFDVYAFRVGGPESRRVGVLFNDITDRKRADDALRRNEERFRALVSASSDVLYRMSPDWSEMRQLNGQGFIADTYEPTTDWLRKYIHPEDQARVKAAFEVAIQTRSTFELEHRVLRLDGSFGWTFSRAVPLGDASGTIAEWFGAATDVTDRKRAEEALLEVNEKLRASDRRKDEFLAMLSHELRNPLAPIRNSIYILRRANPNSEQAQRAHSVIERQTEHLTRLVDDLLDATRIVTGKAQLRRARVDLVDLVRRAVGDHQPLFAERDISFDLVSVDGPLWVDGDPNRLSQVVANLLMNAVKFTQEGGRAAVALTADPHAGTAIIEVTNTGVGIDHALLSRLFEPFMQGEQALDRKFGGLGVGLSIVKGLVERHGGSVTAHSEGPGQGAQFRVELPLVRASTGRARGEGREAPHVARRVLIIEDNRDMAASLKEILEMDGHEVSLAFDGEEGMAKALAFRPNVVLCDIGLPKMSGYAVARALRANDALGSATLIALTGYASSEDRRHAVEAGFDHHFPKPPKLDQILHAIMTGRPGPSAARTTSN